MLSSVHQLKLNLVWKIKVSHSKWHWGPPVSKMSNSKFSHKDRLSISRILLLVQRKPKLGCTKPLIMPHAGRRLDIAGLTHGKYMPMYCLYHILSTNTGLIARTAVIVQVFLRCFKNLNRVPRIENRAPKIREIRSPQVHTAYLTFSLKKPW